jgi:hypothetical protein
VTLPQGPSTTDEDDGAPGFFARNRVIRLASGLVISIVLIAAYLFGIQSYRAGLNQDFPQQTPPTGGVSVVIVPEKVAADAQELPAQLLLFPGGDLLDQSGLLTREVQERIEPAVSGQVLTFPAGEAPAPQAIVLPTPGIVQEYPFDSYAVAVNVSAHSVFADADGIIPARTAIFVRVPGWTDQAVSASPIEGSGQHLATALVRDGSTKSIALLLLLLMVVVAAIAILVTGSATRGRMKLELSVASCMTALLFALIPIRGFFPGAPPLGSWMDIVVFFWVELILMLDVAAVVATILLRARDARHHQAEIH